MSAVPARELEHFLSDLGARRDRVAALVAGSSSEALVDEVSALGERLLVADEELRVQQEELEEARLRLHEQAADRELLTSPNPGVRTDPRGRVLLVNSAAARLVGRPSSPRGFMPVATWFVLPDRAVVRQLVTDALRTRQPQRATGLRAGRVEEEAVEVDVHVRAEVGERGQTLRWRFETSAEVGSHQDEAEEAAVDLLAEDLAAIALDLGRQHTASQLLAAAADLLVGLMRGAEDVALTVVRKGTVELLEATSTAASACESSLFSLGVGPGPDAATRPGEVVGASDLLGATAWPGLAAVGAQHGLRSVVSVAAPLPVNHRRLVLSWYACSPDALVGADVGRVVLLAAAHASVALDRVLTEENLQRAVASRQLIGEVLGMLAVQEGISTQAAFERLVELSQRTNQRLHDVARRLADRLPGS